MHVLYPDWNLKMLVNFIIFFTHCYVHDLECNIHDVVLLWNKVDTQHKRNIYQFIILLLPFTLKTISMVSSYAFRIHRNLEFKICTWEHGWFSCNVHDSFIYLNISFWKRAHLTSFQLNMQLFPICHEQSKRELYFIFCIFLNDFSLTKFVQLIVEWPICVDVLIKNLGPGHSWNK